MRVVTSPYWYVLDNSVNIFDPLGLAGIYNSSHYVVVGGGTGSPTGHSANGGFITAVIAPGSSV